jgi:hypothetical protein
MTVEEQLTNTERDWLVGWTEEAIRAWKIHGNVESEEARLRMIEFFENLKRKLETLGVRDA